MAGEAGGGGLGTGGATAGASGEPGWVVAHSEGFSDAEWIEPDWKPDARPDDGPFSDAGVYFDAQGVSPPEAYRISQPFGAADWLTIESYTRDPGRRLQALAAVVEDPAGGSNKVLRIRSVDHTDATIVRPSAALPNRYRISLRVGFPSFGDGLDPHNGYDSGDESAEPWIDASAVSENGFYWLTILDAVPRPHNNVWIHHHRKVCIDSDNTLDGWMSIWNGSDCETNGTHPVMMFAIDGTSVGSENSGKAFLSYAGGDWGPGICAADAYREDRWYTVGIERFDDRFTLTMTGDFAYGGERTISATIDARSECVWHFNRAPLEADDPCVDDGHYPSLGEDHPHWPSGVGYPDYFLFGDPHVNFYEGTVYYDDVQLEVWKGD